MGCVACHYTGFSGRLGIFEVLGVTPDLRDLIAQDVSATVLKQEAKKAGFRPLIVDGLSKAEQGLTSIEEVLRVVPSESADFLEDTAGDWLEAFQSEPRPASSTPGSGLTKQRVLIADDSEMIRRMVIAAIEGEGYEILVAADGEEALKLAVEESPALLITDFLMPKLDGYELIRKLKSHPATRSIPVIMLTAKVDIESEVKVIEAGADDYLSKPIEPRRLLARVRRLVPRA
jgi:type IV pilus assembly protein PilB